ncbi:MAG: PEP-CTERM sorting domain-containing protein [Paludisphaera borealis]|uniref:PEP-CTERM sorting domain-containing protein n=1 Tax=Paludisphaera borealis TaxID=1387353 RepID=UPI002840C491|nr:PEP-CTERM sorting domain-containing protein [Paludisphaera borealis]MDR3620666.1 PEP-CTERM sorting domain-containing protein [Paludisphaera borealis]
MIRLSMMMGRTAAWVACLVLGLGAAVQAGTVDVYSNNVGGDAVVGASPTVAIGSSGWYYSDVRVGGTIGIDSTFARSGNGSVLFQGDASAGSYKADVSYSTGESLGKLSDLSSLSYDWYRSAASTNNGIQAPALRLLLGVDGVYKGALVFEPYYSLTTPGDVATDTWVHSNIFDPNMYMWSNKDLPFQEQFNHDIEFWKSEIGSYDILGVSSGIGSGWSGTSIAAVDNIHFGFGEGPGTTYNFEVGAVPEPASVVSFLIAGGFGLAGAAYRRRRAR